MSIEEVSTEPLEPMEPASTEVVVAKPSLPLPGEAVRRSGRAVVRLTDLVEPVYMRLYNSNEEFRALRAAVTNEDAVEGVIKDDNTRSALMVREHADDDRVKVAKLFQVRSAVGHVEKRYEGMSRTERQREYQAALEAANPTAL